jgi:hypothetical protein
MKKKKKKQKKADRQKAEAARTGPPPQTRYAAGIMTAWAYVGLLWLLLKYALPAGTAAVEAASFRFLAVCCLGLGFTVVSSLTLLIHRVKRGGKKSES